jgi:hypothetical protein
MMVSKSRAEEVGFNNIKIVSDYPGAELGRVNHHCDKCSKKNSHDLSAKLSEGCCAGTIYKDGVRTNASCGKDYCSGCSVNEEPLYMEISHIGKVLEEGEINGRDDSDFYAVVWDDETGGTKRITYASTRGWTYPNSCTVDATDEIRAKYNELMENARKINLARRLREEAMRPAIGKMVRVVKGRKVPVGETGSIFWFGADNYNRGKMRVGIKIGEEKVFTSADNVEVIVNTYE